MQYELLNLASSILHFAIPKTHIHFSSNRIRRVYRLISIDPIPKLRRLDASLILDVLASNLLLNPLEAVLDQANVTTQSSFNLIQTRFALFVIVDEMTS